MASVSVPPAAPAFMDEQAINMLVQDLTAVASMPPAVGRLAQDSAFIAAVKAGDVQTAAQVSWQFYQQLWDDREQSTAAWQQPYESGQLSSRPSITRKYREYDDDGKFKPGDWVVIQNVRKSGVDSELLGLQAQVLAIEASGWAELHVPKLNCTARVQQRCLATLHTGTPGGRPFMASGTTASHSFQLSGPSARNKGLDRRPTVPGDFSPDTDDGMPRPLRKHHFEGYQRPTTIGQPLPPAKVSTLLGRGVSKARDVCRAVRAELLSLEEAIPWDCVEAGWKARRAAWRKALKNIDLLKTADGLIPPLAAALRELATALLLQKQEAGGPPQPPPAPGQQATTTASAAVAVLAKGGAWDGRLQELALGGNNYAALQHVWDEFHEAIRCWLHSQGHALPPPPQAPSSPQYHHHHHPPHHHTHHHHHHHHHTMPYVPMQSLPRSFDKAVFAVVCKAVEALHAGTPVTSPEISIGQVVADRVVALGRDAAASLRMLLTQAEEISLGSALEAVSTACELGALLGIPPAELERMSDAEILLLLLCSPALRSDLSSLCVTSVDSEPDTDIDDGGDVTDMELSD